MYISNYASENRHRHYLSLENIKIPSSRFGSDITLADIDQFLYPFAKRSRDFAEMLNYALMASSQVRRIWRNLYFVTTESLYYIQIHVFIRDYEL